MPLTPGSLSLPAYEGDRILVTPDGRCRWLCRQHDEIGSASWLLASEAHGLEPSVSDLSEQDCGALMLAWLRGSVATDSVIDKLLSRTAKPAGEPSLPVCGGVSLATEEDRRRLGTSGPVWEESEDPVGAPPHYKLPGDREALEDVIAPLCDALTSRGLSGSTVYMVGNALKYLSRAGAKGSALEDLRKAREYLDRAIQRMDAGA